MVTPLFSSSKLYLHLPIFLISLILIVRLELAEFPSIIFSTTSWYWMNDRVIFNKYLLSKISPGIQHKERGDITGDRSLIVVNSLGVYLNLHYWYRNIIRRNYYAINERFISIVFIYKIQSIMSFIVHKMWRMILKDKLHKSHMTTTINKYYMNYLMFNVFKILREERRDMELVTNHQIVFITHLFMHAFIRVWNYEANTKMKEIP